MSGVLLSEDDVRIPADVFDLAGFRRRVHSADFPQRGKISFLGGEVHIDMSPEEIETHNKIKMATISCLGSWIAQRELGDLLASGALLVHEPADVSTEPDLLFCSFDSLLRNLVTYREAVDGSLRFVEVYGTPDLVVEIFSRYSERKDTRDLLRRYFLAGIPEYWLIDARGESIDFQLLKRGKTRYVAVKGDAEGFRRSAPLGGKFRIARDRNRVGGYRYASRPSQECCRKPPQLLQGWP